MTKIHFHKHRSGFTLIEVLVVVAIVGALGASSLSLMNFNNRKVFSSTVDEIILRCQEAQNRAASGYSQGNELLAYGIMIDSVGINQFATTSNYANRLIAEDFRYDLPSNMQFLTWSLPQTCLEPNDCIIFGRTTGLPTTSGTLTVSEISTGLQSVIHLESTGVIYGE